MKKVLNPHTQTGWNRNTDFCMDVKTFLINDSITKIGKYYHGVLTRDTDEHYSFVESRTSTNGKRNPCIMPGTYINVHRKDDGTLYPTFNRPAYTETFTFRDFCREAAYELMMVAGSYGKNCSVGEE